MKKFIRFILFIVLILVIIVIYARYGGTRGLITKEYKIETSSIPSSYDGLKIVHFSDLHYLRNNNKNLLDTLANEINNINPDIIVFTGDLIDKDYKESDTDTNDLKEFLNNLNSKYGKYSIIGNHDYIKDKELLDDIYTNSDFILLQNSYEIINNESNEQIFIGGLDTYSYDKADISSIMTYFENNDDIAYKIILVHEPDYIDKMEDYNINLVLAGHSHNGQINIPYIKKLFLPYGSKKYYDNYYKVNDTDLYISSGIGTSRLNFRLLNRPSINFYRINKITE